MNSGEGSHSDGEFQTASKEHHVNSGFSSEGEQTYDGSNSKSGGGKRGPPIPAFLKKTYDILENPEYSEYCSWGPNNDSLIVNKVSKFSTIVLPRYFKHSNYASFVRQLNMYGFHKTGSDPQCREFKHPCFIRGRPDLLLKIKRKINGTKGQQGEGGHLFKRGKGEAEALVEQVTQLMGRQSQLEAALEQYRQENLKMKAERQDLWGELEASRKRQSALQARTQRIVMFLFQLYQAHRRQKELEGSSSLPKPPEPALLGAYPEFPEPERDGVSPTQFFNSDMMDLLSRESPSLMDWAKNYPTQSSQRRYITGGHAPHPGHKRRRVSYGTAPASSPDFGPTATPSFEHADAHLAASPPIPMPPASPLSAFLADDMNGFGGDSLQEPPVAEDEDDGRASSRAAVAHGYEDPDFPAEFPSLHHQPEPVVPMTASAVTGDMVYPSSAVPAGPAVLPAAASTAPPVTGFKPLKPGARVQVSSGQALPASQAMGHGVPSATRPLPVSAATAAAVAAAARQVAMGSTSSAPSSPFAASSSSPSLDVGRILQEQASLRDTQQMANNRAGWLEETLHIPSSYSQSPMYHLPQVAATGTAALSPHASPIPVVPGSIPASTPASIPEYPSGSLPVASLPGSLPVTSLPGSLPAGAIPGSLPAASIPGSLPAASIPGSLPAASIPVLSDPTGSLAMQHHLSSSLPLVPPNPSAPLSSAVSQSTAPQLIPSQPLHPQRFPPPSGYYMYSHQELSCTL